MHRRGERPPGETLTPNHPNTTSGDARSRARPSTPAPTPATTREGRAPRPLATWTWAAAGGLALVALLLASPGASAQSCDANAPVILYEKADHLGGCLALYGDDKSFVADGAITFNNGVPLNDQVSSLKVKAGYHAILYWDVDYKGTFVTFSASDLNLADNGFDERASSIRVLPCDPNARVVLFEHADYTGGCIAFNADDTDLTNNVFSNGVTVAGQTTSLWVKEGNQATLFALTGGAGSALVLLHGDAGLMDEQFNDLAKGLRIAAPPAAPANNDHARPALISGAYVYNGREATTAATTQTGEQVPCGSIGRTVWFNVVARHSGKARVSTWGSSFDTVLAAYDGNSLASPLVGCNDDSAGGLQSRLEFTCVAGREYRIQVGGYAGASGNLVFQFSGCLDFHLDPFVTTPVNPACVDATGKRFEVLYVHPNDAPDLYGARVTRIREMVKEMNGFLRQDASAMGRTADYRVKCTSGVIDVANVAVNVPGHGDVIGALKGLGYTNSNVKYIVWLEKRYDCGFGYQTGDPQGTDALDPSNPINAGPTWSVIDCDDSAHGSAVMMHEVGHAMGAVHDGAPDSDGEDHCTDHRSMMCDQDYGTPGSCATLTYDCGYDSYFNPNPRATEDGVNRHWLFTHWNQGHKYNGFLSFPAGPANDDFANRVVVPALPYSQTLSTARATHEAVLPWTATKPTEPSSSACGWQTNTVWYAYTPTVGGTYTAKTAGSNYDTTLAVHTGASLGSLTQVGCNDDTGGGLTSQVTFTATAGTTYRFQVGGYNGATGSLTFQLVQGSGLSASPLEGPQGVQPRVPACVEPTPEKTLFPEPVTAPPTCPAERVASSAATLGACVEAATGTEPTLPCAQPQAAEPDAEGAAALVVDPPFGTQEPDGEPAKDDAPAGGSPSEGTRSEEEGRDEPAG